MKYVAVFHANLNYAYLVPEIYEYVIRASYELLIDMDYCEGCTIERCRSPHLRKAVTLRSTTGRQTPYLA